MSEKEEVISGRNEVAALPDEVKSAPVGPLVGLSSIALTMAMKYHDINTVQDGTLYQQYKLEGKNLHGLHIEEVLDTAERIERWLVGSPERVGKLMIQMLEHADIAPDEDDTNEPSSPETVVEKP